MANTTYEMTALTGAQYTLIQRQNLSMQFAKRRPFVFTLTVSAGV